MRSNRILARECFVPIGPNAWRIDYFLNMSSMSPFFSPFRIANMAKRVGSWTCGLYCMESHVFATDDDIVLLHHARLFDCRPAALPQIGLGLEGGNLARELVPQRRVEVECVREQRQIGVALQDAMLVLCVRRFGSEHRAENVAHCDVNVRFLVFRRWQQQQRLEQFRVAVET